MKYLKKLIIADILLYVALFASADISDTLIYLDQVIIKGLKFNEFTIGSKFYSFDTLTLRVFKTGSLADILMMDNSVALKTYGPGGMASLSVRGGSTRHTAVIWNGFNITNPMSGGINFSALPAGFIDKIAIQPGGSSTMYGSGSSCGAILLSNKLDLNGKGLNIDLSSELGSFSAFSNLFSIGYLGKKISSRIKAGYQIAENDFRFKNQEKYGKPIDTLRHAAYLRYSFLHQLAFRTGKRSILETDLWYIKHHKNIPALTSDYEEGTEEQTDENLRLSFNYSIYEQKWFIKYQSGLLIDNVLYTDRAGLGIRNLNESYAFINELEGKYSLGKYHEINLGFNQTWEKARSQNYTLNISRNRLALFGRYNFAILKKKIRLSTELREEYVEGKFIPIVFSVGTDIGLISGLHFKGIISKHYALPVFDDLYWIEDAYSRGNSELTPEYGWNNEVGILFLLEKDHSKISHELSFFRNYVHDLIIWLPGEDGKWTPENINESLSRGIEFSGSIKRDFRNSNISFRYMYAFTRALIWEEGEERPSGANRIYVPEHVASLSAGLKVKNLEVRYLQTFTGKRYYDDFHTLDAYTIGDVFFNLNWIWGITRIDTYFKIMNVFNTSYQIMMGYAQAPRSYALGINLSFN